MTIERDQVVEERIVNIGEHSDKLYFIANGDFEVFVKDQHGIETFVHFLEQGDLFGEVGLITSNPRSATVSCRNYGTLGTLESIIF